jgi:hypothetical protein
MAAEAIDSVLPLLKLLANETRLRVIGIVAEREASVGALARRLELTEATMSHHLSKLTEAGLLTMRAEGTSHYYRLDPKALHEINRSLQKPDKLLAAPPSASGSSAEARVLRTFVANGRITKMPLAEGKRLVILKWVVDQLEDRRYREKEVSEVLKAFYDDYATLRRELINHRLMKRENGIYWKAGK